MNWKGSRKTSPSFRATNTSNSQDLQWGKTATRTGRVRIEAGQEPKHLSCPWRVSCSHLHKVRPGIPYVRTESVCTSPRSKSSSQWAWLRKSNLQWHWSLGLNVHVYFSWYPLGYPLCFLGRLRVSVKGTESGMARFLDYQGPTREFIQLYTQPWDLHLKTELTDLLLA